MPPQPDSRWRAVERVLAVRLDNLGDILMTAPALLALKHGLSRPDRPVHLSLLATPAASALLPMLPCVDEAIVHRAAWVKGDEPRDDEQALVRRLRQGRFDAAVIFTVCSQSALPAALVCRMAGIPLRLAYSRENPYGLLSDWAPDADVVVDGMRHEVKRQLDLVARIGCTEAVAERAAVQIDRAAIVESELVRRSACASAGVPAERPWFAVHVGASAASRRYDPLDFGRAAAQLARATGWTPIFCADASERALVDAALTTAGPHAVSLAGLLDLRTLAGVIAGSRLLIANNSAPMHLAAALGTPLVALYALTNPQHTPWSNRAVVLNHPVPCRNCLKSVCPQVHHDCLRRVQPEQIVAAALQLGALSPTDARLEPESCP